MMTNRDSGWPGLMANIEHELTYDEVFDACGNPKAGPDAIKQASYGAHDLERDREQAA